MMLCILNNSHNIYFNLAAEEYLLKQKQEDILMLWISDPCIVVGKHQNVFAEINHQFVYEKNIPVARRLSGGGTVFHDKGNLNFTFIANGQKGKLVDFRKFVTPIVEFLDQLGIKATIGEKNDILIGSLKISGNAEHVHKNRVLHHGTLLFNSDLKILKEALKVTQGRYIDKAVQSNRSSVCNISTYLMQIINIDYFREQLYKYLLKKNSNSVEYQFSEPDLINIRKLQDEKYNQWDWTYGYSPSSTLVGELTISKQNFKIEFYIEKGNIIKIVTDAPDIQKSIEFISLSGCKLYYPDLLKEINNFSFPAEIKNQLIRLIS